MTDWVAYNEHDELVRAMRQIEQLEGAIECLIIGAAACAIPHEGERKVLQEAVSMARALSTEHGQKDIVDECACVDLRETIDGMKRQKCGKLYTGECSEVLGSGDASVSERQK